MVKCAFFVRWDFLCGRGVRRHRFFFQCIFHRRLDIGPPEVPMLTVNFTLCFYEKNCQKLDFFRQIANFVFIRKFTQVFSREKLSDSKSYIFPSNHNVYFDFE